MLQILVWVGCVLIIGVGYCAMHLAMLTANALGKKSHRGDLVFVLMTIAAIVLFIVSLFQGKSLRDLLSSLS